MTDENLDRVILVVEQDELLLDDTCSVLRRSGWHVLEATSAEQAFDLMRSFLIIHVLVVDIAISQTVSGWDIADAFRVVQPRSAVVYTSEPIEDRTRAVPSSVLFLKPYDPKDVGFVCSTLRDVQSAQGVASRT